jgi:hypothetical protein
MPINSSVKNLENTQFGRVSTENGNRRSGGTIVDYGLDPLVDSHGRIIVRLAGGNGFIENTTVDYSSGAVYTNTFFLGSVIEREITINGYSDLPVPAHLLFFKNTFLVPGSLPAITIPLAAGPGAFFKEVVIRNGSSGTWEMAISSTKFLYTPIATPALYVYATALLSVP